MTDDTASTSLGGEGPHETAGAASSGRATGGGRGGGKRRGNAAQAMRSDASDPKAQTNPASGKQKKQKKAGGKQGRQQGRGRAKAMQAAEGLPQKQVRPVSKGFRLRFRHFVTVFTFLVFVVAPTSGAWWYLDTRAADQYASSVGFVVRQADSPTATSGGLLGTLSTLSGGASKDADILYEFIQSQQLVEEIDKDLNLRAIYNKPDNDPLFTLGEGATIEDLMWYWSWAVNIYYDSGTGLIELRVLAFDPKDAQNIAAEISARSSEMINRLSAIARDDATRYAREDLDKAFARLRETRQTLTAFRNETQIVDPTADVQGRMGLLNYLQQLLADTMIEQDLLMETTSPTDPRLKTTQRKIAVIQDRISAERKTIGLGDDGGSGKAFSNLVGEYEGLIVDREFAEQAYVTALANYDSAVAEANRQSRYLAEYIEPTLSEEAQYPQRIVITIILGLFLLLSWFTLTTIAYSIRDRK